MLKKINFITASLSFLIFGLFLFLPTVSVYAGDNLFPSDLPAVNLSRDGVYELFLDVARLAIFILPGIALLFIIFGAFRMITGGEDGQKAGWSIIKNSLIGLVIAGVSFIIIGLVTGIIEEIYTGGILNLG